jgi:hypothetical protein
MNTIAAAFPNTNTHTNTNPTPRRHLRAARRLARTPAASTTPTEPAAPIYPEGGNTDVKFAPVIFAGIGFPLVTRSTNDDTSPISRHDILS